MFGERLFGGGYGGRYDTRHEQMFGVFCPYFARNISPFPPPSSIA
jgi:hypothetical protein